MKLIEPNTPSWYESRIGKFTASCFGLLMTSPADKTRSLSRTAEKYIRQKARECRFGRSFEEEKDFPAIHWGYRYEAEALEAFACYMEEYEVKAGGLSFHPDWPDVGATPDALLYEKGSGTPCATLQVKCPHKTHNHLKYCEKIHDGPSLKKVAKKYYWQVQGEMWVFDLPEAWFISYDPRLPEGEDIHYVRILRNEDDLTLLTASLLRAITLRDEWAGL